MDFRQITVVSQDICREGGRKLATPCRRVAACGVRHDPHANAPAIDDVSALVELSFAAGEVLTARALAALKPLDPHGYGKAALVGTAGGHEHGAAMTNGEWFPR